MIAEPTLPPHEVCIECGFDASLWARQDAIRTVEKAGWLAELAIERMPGDLWMERPDPSRRAIGEHVNHLGNVMAAHRLAAELSVVAPGTNLGEFPDEVRAEAAPDLDQIVTLATLGREAKRHGAYLRSIDADLWGKTNSVDGEGRSLDWGVRHTAHEVMHHTADIGWLRHRLGDALDPIEGAVASLHASDGGVPKLKVPSADIGVGGIAGDRQASRQYHGRPWQALCLWSAEVVDALAAEGHPIFPGAAGENLSIEGLDWSQVRSGLTVEIGTMVARISAPAIPCAKNSRWFTDGDQRRLGYDVRPGRARWYASVLAPGTVLPGDTVVIRSDGS